jgi:hypothetical protein
MRGFANGTTVSTTSNSTQCEASILYIISDVNATKINLKNNLTFYGVLVSFDLMIDITYNVYGLNFNCYYGAQEAIA